jgi:hypothetical protein
MDCWEIHIKVREVVQKQLSISARGSKEEILFHGISKERSAIRSQIIIGHNGQSWRSILSLCGLKVSLHYFWMRMVFAYLVPQVTIEAPLSRSSGIFQVIDCATVTPGRARRGQRNQSFGCGHLDSVPRSMLRSLTSNAGGLGVSLVLT